MYMVMFDRKGPISSAQRISTTLPGVKPPDWSTGSPFFSYPPLPSIRRFLLSKSQSELRGKCEYPAAAGADVP